MNIKHNQEKTAAIAELLYLAVTAIYLLKMSFDGTVFYIPWPENFENILRIMICMTIFLKLGYTKAYAGREWLVCTLSCAAFGLSWVFTGYSFLLDTALLIMGAVGLPYRNILTVGFWTNIYVLTVAMLGSFTGCIPDRVYIEGTHFRHSFGIVYLTDFSAHIVFLVMAGWILYGGNSYLGMTAWTLGFAFFIYYYCRAKCSTAILILLAVCIIYFFLTEKYKREHRIIYQLSKKCDAALIYVMFFCILLSIGLTFFNNRKIAFFEHLNSLLSYRLDFGKAAMDKYGITLFGTPFPLIGFGGGTVWSGALEYNFVDCSYVLILVRYGLLVLAAVCIQYMLLERKALKNNLRKLALAAALVSVHSMVEHHLPEPTYNLFLLLPFADLTYREHHRKKLLFCRRTFFNRMICIPGIIVITAVFPRIITYIKTLIDIFQVDLKERNIWFIAVASAVLFIGFLFIFLLLRIISALMHKAFPPKGTWFALAGILLLFFCALLKTESAIHCSAEKYQNLLDADRPVMEILLADNSLTGRLYVDCVPEIYLREFGKISHMVLAAEGIVHQENVTLITSDDAELPALIQSGYQYGRLASGHAVYTNSSCAKKRLEETGITFTSYYSRQNTIDLMEMAEKNHLDMTADNTLLLDGYEKSLWHGSGITIYKGMLRVEYKLRFISGDISGGIAASTRISSDWGERVWFEYDILPEYFDENGEYTCAIDLNLYGGASGMEFLVIVPDGVKLELLEINYGKIE